MLGPKGEGVGTTESKCTEESQGLWCIRSANVGSRESELLTGLRPSFFDPAREGASLNARGGRDPRDLGYSPRLSAGAMFFGSSAELR